MTTEKSPGSRFHFSLRRSVVAIRPTWGPPSSVTTGGIRKKQKTRARESEAARRLCWPPLCLPKEGESDGGKLLAAVGGLNAVWR